MSKAYPKELRQIVLDAGKLLGLEDCMHEGIYFQTSGPAFETAAEARLMRIAGEDVVGKCYTPATSNTLICCHVLLFQVNALILFL